MAVVVTTIFPEVMFLLVRGILLFTEVMFLLQGVVYITDSCISFV